MKTTYIIVQISNCKIPEIVLLNMELYVKGFQRIHAGEDVRPVASCKFLRNSIEI